MVEGFALAGAAAGQTAAAEPVRFTLYVRDGWLPMPDGGQVYVWGFTDDPKGPPKVPAPPIVVNEGDAVEVTLVNDRDPTANQLLPFGEGHTIHLHGLDTTMEHDGVPETYRPGLVRQGERYTYQFIAKYAGTYFYHCHQNNVEHQQMGMYGPLIVRAARGAKAAYTGGPAFDREYTLTLAEMDPRGHEAARRAFQEGDDPYNWLRYAPKYFLINDQAFEDPASISTTLQALPGERVLVRVINAGYVAHVISLGEPRPSVVATDGRPWAEAPSAEAVWLGPGEKYDLLLVGNESGSLRLSDRVRDAYPGPMIGAPSPSASSLAPPSEQVQRLTWYVRDGWQRMPDGTEIYVYGFSEEPGGQVQVPGPVIVAEEGDTVEITLVNDRATGRAYGLSVPGPGVVVEGPDAVEPGEAGAYRLGALRAGSYLYSGTSPEDQQMGMYGALVVRPGGEKSLVYSGGPSFDQEYTMVLSEMDSAAHLLAREAIEDELPTHGWASPYAPNYFLINGLAYPDTERDSSTMMHVSQGQRVLIRAINGGQVPHSMHLHGYHFQLVGVNGLPWPTGPLKDTVLIAPGESYDLLFAVDQEGVFPFHDHFEIANTNNGVWLGGMHTLVASGPGHGPVVTEEPAASLFEGPRVFVRDNFYTPNILTIPAGATVRWEHQGKVEHTVTSLFGFFDSGPLQGGDAFEYTFTVPGRYDYFCRFHITNRGIVVVG